MSHFSMKEAERIIGKFLVLLLCFLFCSLLLLIGMGFLGFSLYEAFLQWLSPAYSALLTGSVFLLVTVVVISAARRTLTTKRRGPVTPVSVNGGEFGSLLTARPATCLSVAVLAGYLYESQPRLKEQVGNTLADLAQIYTVELKKKHQA
mgnify:CR=1 FL=1